MEDNKKYGGLDYFKILAAFLVVAIHTSPLTSFNNTADFILTRVIGRVAVPFFFMVTGYFMMSGYLFHKSKSVASLLTWVRKNLLLYAGVIVLYLPVNFYAGQLKGAGISDILRMLLFDGTFYHLWYLPASVVGVLLVYLISRKLPFKAVLGITLLLYGIGLFGDSYYGLISNLPFISSFYDTLFQVFSYTRNGLFFAPIFLVMGAWIAQTKGTYHHRTNFIGLFLSFAFMLAEGLTLHSWGVQRHDSMYIGLLPCMFFLFQIILSIEMPPVTYLRSLSTWIYLLHPLFIVLVRGGAKVVGLESLFIDNSLIHYIAVSVLSLIFSVFIVKFSTHKNKQPFHQERAWIEISKKNLHKNIDTLQELLPPGCQLMPAVKANAYGHGAVLIARELSRCGVSAFCVATVDEGVELRRNGINGQILVLGYTHPEQFSLLKRYHLIQTVVDYSHAKALNSYGKKIKVHLKIDTGMHRLGFRHEKIDELCRVFEFKNLVIEGAYTHLCTDETKSPIDKEFTFAQGEAFYHVIEQLERRGYHCPNVHLQASYGLINYPELAGDYARIGIAIYGLLSNRADLNCCTARLYPVLSVKARVASIRDLFEGEAAGYGLQCVAAQDRKIAALTIGYADGLPRALSCGVGRVLINGTIAPIIGRICMDQMLVDVTDIPDVKQGDIAVIIGKSGEYEISAYDIAEQSGTITNEVLSQLGDRLCRMMV